MTDQITVDNIPNNPRIDIFLMNKINNLTRTSSKKICVLGIAKLNGQRVPPNKKICIGDIITIDRNELKEFLGSSDKTELKITKMDLDIIFEDENTIVTNKPAKLISHPVPGHRDDTLLNGLIYYARNISKSKNTKIRLVHRLDRETSGVILASKTVEANNFYSKQFEHNKTKKVYFAKVSGNASVLFRGQNYVDFQSFLVRSKKDKKIYESFENSSSKDAKLAKTRFFLEKASKNYSLLRVEPYTGRTHQIRAHLKELDFPIIGDYLYGGKKFERLMLHAYSLRIKLFGSGEEKEFVSKLPEVFNQFL